MSRSKKKRKKHSSGSVTVVKAKTAVMETAESGEMPAEECVQEEVCTDAAVLCDTDTYTETSHADAGEEALSEEVQVQTSEEEAACEETTKLTEEPSEEITEEAQETSEEKMDDPEEIPVGGKVFSKGLLAFIAASLLLFIGCAIFSLVTLTRNGSQIFARHYDVDLTDYIGRDIDEVMEEEKESSFKFQVIREYNADYPVGIIFDQTPNAPKIVKDNANVVLRVSMGVERVRVPDVQGMTYGDAMRALKDQKLIVTRKSDKSKDYAQNTVTRIEPESGTILDAGSVVTIYVNMPQSTSMSKVPNVVGLDFSAAKSMLGAFGLRIGTVTQVEDFSLPPNTVISQSVNKGSRVALGTRINLTISIGYDIIQRSFKLQMPYKDAKGNTSYTVEFLVGSGDTAEKLRYDKVSYDSGFTFTRKGSVNERVQVKVGGKLYRVYEFDYQNGTYSILEDYSGSGFIMDPPMYTVSVSCGTGGYASYNSSVAEGKKTSVIISVTAGYEIASVFDNGVDVTSKVSGGVYVISSMDTDHHIEVSFTYVGE